MPPAIMFATTILALHFRDDVSPAKRIAIYAALSERSRQLGQVPASDKTLAAITRTEARLLGLRARVRHHDDRSIDVSVAPAT